jgi:phage terminase small subunit
MAVINNPRREEFALRVAQGEDATKVYISLGYSAKSAMCCASRLQSDAKVAARIAEIKANLQRAVEAQVGVTKAWVIEKLVENVNRAMQAMPVLDREGNETGGYTYQGNVANKGLELIGRELGMFKEQVDHNMVNGPIRFVLEGVSGAEWLPKQQQ